MFSVGCEFSIASKLRSVSQQQKNGILTISTEDDVLCLSVSEGKIVAVNSQRYPLSKGLVDRMSRVGIIEDEDQGLMSLAESSPSRLYQNVVGGGFLSHEMFVKLKFAYERDVLDSLILVKDAEVDFQTQLVHADETLSQQIYPGQLLLDLLELEVGGRRFSEIFGEDIHSQLLIRHKVEDVSGLTEVEQTMWEVIGSGALLGDLLASSVLSLNQTQFALLALHEQQFIDVLDADAVGGEDFLSLSPEAAKPDEETATDSDEMEDLSLQEVLDEEVVDSEIEESNEMEDYSPLSNPYSHDGSGEMISDEDFANLANNGGQAVEISDELSSIEESIVKKNATRVSEKFVQNYALFFTVLFLAFLGLYLPDMLAEFLSALRHFVVV